MTANITMGIGMGVPVPTSPRGTCTIGGGGGTSSVLWLLALAVLRGAKLRSRAERAATFI